MGIRIDENDEFVRRRRDPALQGTSFPEVLLTNQADSSVGGRYLLNLNGGIVTRTVIDHDDLQLTLILGLQERLECCVDDFAFVVSGNDDTDRFSKIHRRRTAETISQ